MQRRRAFDFTMSIRESKARTTSILMVERRGRQSGALRASLHGPSARASRSPTEMPDDRAELRELLSALDGVTQNPRWHPEGDALYHSLQALDVARRLTREPLFWIAGLFHDVGKAVDSATHDEVGADLLDGLVPERIVWLVSHHLDLLRDPRRTRRRVVREDLRDLELLRTIDLGARSPDARVLPVDEALDLALHALAAVGHVW